MDHEYSEHFYVRQKTGSLPSAEAIVPHLLSITGPLKSVIDVGCGLGTWLSVFTQHGATTVCGVDSPYAKRTQSYIPDSAFVSTDLEQPLPITDTFDLAVSLEVAEHLNPARAAQFVTTLTARAPLVLFSGAIPGQGGTHHVNEQWPDYWETLFAAHGYVALDCIRRPFWNDTRVCYWYAQNAILYVREAERARLRPNPAHCLDTKPVMRLVHPALYESINPRRHASRKLLFTSLVHALLRRPQQ